MTFFKKNQIKSNVNVEAIRGAIKCAKHCLLKKLQKWFLCDWPLGDLTRSMQKYSDAATGEETLVKQELAPRRQSKAMSATVTYHSDFCSSTQTIFNVLRRFFFPDQTSSQEAALHSDVSVTTYRSLSG